jgi:hypothetical protein
MPLKSCISKDILLFISLEDCARVENNELKHFGPKSLYMKVLHYKYSEQRIVTSFVTQLHHDAFAPVKNGVGGGPPYPGGMNPGGRPPKPGGGGGGGIPLAGLYIGNPIGATIVC